MGAVPIRCVIFDYDGTLLGGTSLWVPALARAMSRIGVQVPHDELKEDMQTLSLDGSLWARIIRKWCPGQETEALSIFNEVIMGVLGAVELSSKTLELLRNLRGMGVRTGIVTFRTRESIEGDLLRMGVSDLIDIIVGVGDTEEAKPSPLPYVMVCERLGVDPNECLVVGDEPADILGASQVDMRSVGVLSGFSNRSRLEKLGADFIIESVEELLDLMAGL